MPAPSADPPVALMLELPEPPVAAVFTAAHDRSELSASALAATTQAQLSTIENAQQSMLAALAELDVPVLYRVQRVYNGIAVLAPVSAMASLAQIPGVAAVHRIHRKQPDNAVSVPFLGAPQLWQGSTLPGVRGEGITIAVIDTGIDYLHTDFGGPGSGYAQNDRTRLGDVPGFPGVKVVGGYDFAGDRYNADPEDADYQPIPIPDPDPMDCYAHGTHVAGTAAGFGVAADGATYAGPYDASTNFGAFRVGPGVAPLAQIYALKVFGCTGSSDITDVAIEWAVDPNGDGDFADAVDVINLSLGSPYGNGYDTTTVAANNAAAMGVIVVASAGNSGDNYFVVGSPSTGDRVISVAASQHGIVAAQYAPIRTDTLAGFTARGPRRNDAALKPDLAAPGVSILSAASLSGNSGRVLSGTSMAAPHVAGAAGPPTPTSPVLERGGAQGAADEHGHAAGARQQRVDCHTLQPGPRRRGPD